jgi:hypothetical protein
MSTLYVGAGTMCVVIDFCNSNQGFVMAVLTAVYVIATFVLAYLGIKSNRIARDSIKNLQEMEKERFRPYVYCEFFFVDIFLNFAVINCGMTQARNIKLKFDSPLCRLKSHSPEAVYQKEEIAFLNRTIGSLSPGQKLDTLIGYFGDFRKEYPSCKITCTVSYESFLGTTYEETMILDVTYAESRVSIKRKTIEQVATSLEKIENIAHHIATGFHKPRVLIQGIEQWRQETNDFIAKNHKMSSGIDNSS